MACSQMSTLIQGIIGYGVITLAIPGPSGEVVRSDNYILKMKSDITVVSLVDGTNFDLPNLELNQMDVVAHGEQYGVQRQMPQPESGYDSKVKVMVGEDPELSVSAMGWCEGEMRHVSGSQECLTIFECCVCFEEYDGDTTDSVIYPCSHEHQVCPSCTMKIVVNEGPACKCPVCRRSFWWTDLEEVEMEVRYYCPFDYEKFIANYSEFGNPHRNSPEDSGSHGEISEDGWIKGKGKNDASKRQAREEETNRHRKNPGSGGKQKFGARPEDLKRIQEFNEKREKRMEKEVAEGFLKLKEKHFQVDSTAGLGFTVGDAKISHAEVQSSGEKHEDFVAASKQQFVNNLDTHVVFADARMEIHERMQKKKVLLETQIEQLRLIQMNDPDYNEEVAMQMFLKEYNQLTMEIDVKLNDMKKQKIEAEYNLLKETFEMREQMEDWTFKLNKAHDEGKIVKEFTNTEIIEFVAYYVDEHGVVRKSPYQDRVDVIKINSNASDKQKMDLLGHLVPAPLFIVNEKRSIFRKVLTAFAAPFWRKWDKRGDKTSWYTGDSRYAFMPEGAWSGDLQDNQLNKYADRTNIDSLLKNYRILGFESHFIRSLFTSGLGYFENRGFDAAMTLLVHPLLVQRARLMIGARDKQTNSVDNIKNEIKKEFGHLLPYQVISDSVLVGCQQADAIDYLTTLAFKKNKVGEVNS
jgi:hypothetical protein